MINATDIKMSTTSAHASTLQSENEGLWWHSDKVIKSTLFNIMGNHIPVTLVEVVARLMPWESRLQAHYAVLLTQLSQIFEP